MEQQVDPALLKKSTGIKCSVCKGDTFIQAFYLRLISKFLTGDPQDSVVPMPAFTCVKCGNVNDEFKPTLFRILDEENKEADKNKENIV